MKTLSNIFRLSSYISLIGWITLLFLPSWQNSQTIVIGVSVTLLCGIYTYLIFFGKRHDKPGLKVRGSFWSLKGVIGLFKSPRFVLAGWVHYLAFDLMAGLFIISNAAHYSIPHWMLIPCLLMTLLFGPAGLLLYLLLRFFITHNYLAINFF